MRYILTFLYVTLDLFIERGFAGLRKNFDVTPELMEAHAGKEKLGDEKNEAAEKDSGEF